MVLIQFSLFGQHHLSICSIFKNEAPYLREWIEFHKIQGVEHFYLYNNKSEDNFFEILRPYVDMHEVTLIDWPYTYESGNHDRWMGIQVASYTDCLTRYGRDNEWVAFLDIDEFLYCPSGQRLPDFLHNYLSYGGVGVSWRMFGTSKIERIPQNRCMIEMLIRCNTLSSPLNYFYKSIVQPSCVSSIVHPHSCMMKEPYCTVDADMQKLEHEATFSKNLCQHKICINHYWSRTEEYFRANKLPSEIKRGRGHTESRLAALHHCVDREIQRFVPELRKRLGYER
jgi:hypothetical protein